MTDASPFFTGSSPLARGARGGRGREEPRVRIIPARAGSTGGLADLQPEPEDHPRSRGEHLMVSTPLASVTGSSPLARGAPVVVDDGDPHRGIIPARAGSTSWRSSSRSPTRDHPRSRGEHLGQSRITRAVRGSSPLARGAHRRPLLVGHRGGIIPARAGSTPSAFMTCTAARDHPRSRGEHSSGCSTRKVMRGSSPLARGAHMDAPVPRVRPGISPARAGSTSTRRSRGPSTRDHPRSRGEHSSYRSMIPYGVGSSPLARGALHLQHRRVPDEGIIPARAGSTTRWSPPCPC